MIQIKSEKMIQGMRTAGKIAGKALLEAAKAVCPGITTAKLDEIIRKCIVLQGGIPACKGYGGFPANACISVNDEVIHGIPSKRILNEGDIVSLDLVAGYDGFYGDCAATLPVGKVSERALNLIAVTRQCFFEGIKFAREGYRVSDISHSVQTCAESAGYSVVRDYIGHGIGRAMHEDPEVANFGAPGHGPRLQKGMTIAVEPMINEGGARVRVLNDGWTVITADGKLSAHYEHTILITEDEPEILTAVDGEVL